MQKEPKIKDAKIQPKKDPKNPTALATLAAMGSIIASDPMPMGNHRYAKPPIKKGDAKKKKARKRTKKARRKNR